MGADTCLFSLISISFRTVHEHKTIEPLKPLRALKTLRRAPRSVASVLFSVVSDSSAYKTPALGTQKHGRGWRRVGGVGWLCWLGAARDELLRPISAKSLD